MNIPQMLQDLINSADQLTADVFASKVTDILVLLESQVSDPTTLSLIKNIILLCAQIVSLN